VEQNEERVLCPDRRDGGGGRRALLRAALPRDGAHNAGGHPHPAARRSALRNRRRERARRLRPRRRRKLLRTFLRVGALVLFPLPGGAAPPGGDDVDAARLDAAQRRDESHKLAVQARHVAVPRRRGARAPHRVDERRVHVERVVKHAPRQIAARARAALVDQAST
jgi:hypothetical protein